MVALLETLITASSVFESVMCAVFRIESHHSERLTGQQNCPELRITTYVPATLGVLARRSEWVHLAGLGVDLSGYSACCKHALVDYEDRSEYSDDLRYRWWYERRWSDGPALCWIGLNPSTGDTIGRPRPTLRRIVERAQKERLGAVVVVNLFSWRATEPADLRAAHASGIDIIGERTDAVIKVHSERSRLTLVAWGTHGSILDRGDQVARMLARPMCLGVTRHGEPRHPLYVASTVAPTPFVRRFEVPHQH